MNSIDRVTKTNEEILLEGRVIEGEGKTEFKKAGARYENFNAITKTSGSHSTYREVRNS